jgi:hypothetical protein
MKCPECHIENFNDYSFAESAGQQYLALLQIWRQFEGWRCNRGFLLAKGVLLNIG